MQAILLTAFEKMAVAEPDSAALQVAVSDVLGRYSHYMDAELQQRAVEYEQLKRRLPVARAALAPLPRWEKRSSLLLRRLAEKEGEGADESRERPAWLLAGEPSEGEEQPGSAVSAGGTGAGPLRAPSTAAGSAPSTAKAANGVPDLLDLSDLDLGLTSPQPAAAEATPAALPPVAAVGAPLDLLSLSGPAVAPAPAAVQQAAVGAPATAAAPPAADEYAAAAAAPLAAAAVGAEAAPPPAPPAIQPVGDVDAWFRKLATGGSGVLYEDPYLQVQWMGVGECPV